MQNSSIIYHSESITETLIFGLCVSYYSQTIESGEVGAYNKFLMLALLIEHVFSYVTHIFREHDIKANGKIDINGIKRAPTEQTLQKI